MKKHLLLFLLITAGCCLQVFSQIEESSFGATGRGGTSTTFATDYQAIGINPANLGFDNKYGIALGIGEVGYSFYSEALLRDDVRDIVFNHIDSITPEQEEVLAQAFIESGMATNLDIMPMGLSFRVPKFGTLGISAKINSTYRSKFGGEAAHIIFEGYNYEEYFDTIIVTATDVYAVAYEPLSLSQLFDGTDISLNAKSEVNLAYGNRFVNTEKLDIFAGLGVKYIMSHAYMSFVAEDGKITGISALGLDLVDLDHFETPSEITTNPYQPVGKGWGFDFGVSVKVGETLTLGAALTDIGKVKYDANVLQLNDYVLDTLSFSGVSSTDPMDILEQILHNENIISYSGLASFEENLPTNFRIGGSLKLLGEMLDVGVDAVFPMNDVAGSYTAPVLGLGGQVRLFKFIKPSAGISAGGGYEFNVPAGLTFDFTIWEAGIASRDILTLFGEKRPTVSFAFGFLRFKI